MPDDPRRAPWLRIAFEARGAALRGLDELLNVTDLGKRAALTYLLEEHIRHLDRVIDSERAFFKRQP